MKVSAIALSLFIVGAAGCASAPEPATAGNEIASAQAVQMAAAAAPAGVSGVFAVQVQATDTSNGITYLNSEMDYRDQRNLSIAIEPLAARQLEAQLGSPPAVALKGKRLLVNGVASRVTIAFIVDGKATDKYYYQTHVTVTDPKQIQILAPGTGPNRS